MVAKPGLHSWADPGDWPYDPLTMSDLKALPAGWWVKVLVPGTPPWVIRELVQSGHPVMIRIFVKFEGDNVNRYKNPIDLLKDVYLPIKQAVDAGASVIEILNEPNLHIAGSNPEGYGLMWNSGRDFAEYGAAIDVTLKSSLPNIKTIFPGLSPGFDIPGVRMNDVRFRNEAWRLTEYADYIGVHAYWGNGSSVYTAINDVNAFVRTATKPVWVTEFSNVNPHTSRADKAKEYKEFFRMCEADAAFIYLYAATVDPRGEALRNTDGMKVLLER